MTPLQQRKERYRLCTAIAAVFMVLTILALAVSLLVKEIPQAVVLSLATTLIASGRAQRTRYIPQPDKARW